ncbi:MAG TPA: hypothetical protein VH092_21750 [Urbifossiella sp.]|jgi:hypothetical protein|nr:hypothetical protein [Urbifossiella sp.]
MPKLCEGCGFYSADNTPAKCPSCDAALKFTFLPPAGKPAAPVAGLPTDPYGDLERRQRAARTGFFGVDWRIVKAVCVGLVTVGFMGVRFYLRQEARAEREARENGPTSQSAGGVRPGMHISEAARLLDTGSGMHVPGTTRLRDRFSRDDDSDGTITADDVTVTWQDGYVTSVERQNGSGGGGMRRRTTVVTGGPDDDAGDGPQPGRVVHPAERLVAQPGGDR